jgi:DNA-binding NarL/FixJ family response regulator
MVQIISETMDMDVAAEASTASEVFENVRTGTFDVVVLDLNMGDSSGLEVLKNLKAEFPNLPVLILSVYPENQFAVRTLRAGASGYLNKDSAPEQLVKAVRRVSEGKRYVSPSVAEELLFQLDADNEGPRHEMLSDREFQVLRMLAAGNTVSEIAEILSLSVKTISTYRSRVLEKMNMKSNAELTHYAIKNDLIL